MMLTLPGLKEGSGTRRSHRGELRRRGGRPRQGHQARSLHPWRKRGSWVLVTLPRRQMLAGRGLLLHSPVLVSRLSFVSVFLLFFFLASLLPLLPRPSFSKHGGHGHCCRK